LLQCSRQAGFSLLELLVVVFVIALGAELISLSIGSNSPQQLRTSVSEFVNLTTLVEEEAVLSREPWGVQLYREGNDGEEIIAYRFLHFVGEKGWQVEAPPDLSEGGHFAENVTAILELEGAEQLIEPLPEKKPPQPTIWLAPGGEVTPFVLQLRFKGMEDGPVVRSDALGRIQLELQKDDESLK
jgi:type II secretion system protein H